jgi:hypothetical protein
VLSELRPWLRRQPPIDQFQEQLEATVRKFWATRRFAVHLCAANEALRQVRRATLQAKTALRKMEEGSALDMSLSLRARVRDALIPLNELEQGLSKIPRGLSGQQKPRKGPTPRVWYSFFVHDLAEIAGGIGIDVTTAGDRADDPATTPFVRFVFAVEKLLPPGEGSPSLAACAKRIDRAIATSRRQIGGAIARSGKRRNRAGIRLRDK